MKKEKASPVECDEEGMEESVPSSSKQVESDGKFPVPKLRLPARVKKVGTFLMVWWPNKTIVFSLNKI